MGMLRRLTSGILLILTVLSLTTTAVQTFGLDHLLHEGKYLPYNHIHAERGLGLQSCVEECQIRSYCASVNYDRDHFVCEFNVNSSQERSSNVLDRSNSVLVDMVGSTYVLYAPVGTTDQGDCRTACGSLPYLCPDSLLKNNLLEKEKPEGKNCIALRDVCRLTISTGKNARIVNTSPFVGKGVTVIHECVPGYVGRNATQTCRGGDVWNPVQVDIHCYREYTFPGDPASTSWALIFRAKQNQGQPVLNTWLKSGSAHETDPDVDVSCEKFTTNSACENIYRTSVIDNWRFHQKTKIKLALFDGRENLLKEVIFSYSGTSNTGWFSSRNVLSSTWPSLTASQSYQHFQIQGPTGVGRSFDITTYYGGCDNDAGYMMVIEGPGDCDYDNYNFYPKFIYCPGPFTCRYNSEWLHAKYLAIFVASDDLLKAL